MSFIFPHVEIKSVISYLNEWMPPKKVKFSTSQWLKDSRNITLSDCYSLFFVFTFLWCFSPLVDPEAASGAFGDV